MKRKFTYLSLSLFLAFAFAACATFTPNAYKSLTVSKITYDSALSSASDLYSKGILDDKDKAKVIKYGTLYKQAHNAAVSALLEYDATGSTESKEKYYDAISSASEFLSVILEIVETEMEVD